MSKTYRCASGITEYVFEIKHSKFIATVSGEVDAESAEAFVKSVKAKYPDATHNCYAYVSDVSGQATRFSDDGEPGGTAGQPILKVLTSRGIVRTAIVVTRYFGGIKLGTGGLVSAYTEAAAGAIDRATVLEMVECKRLTVRASYDQSPAIDRLLKRNGYPYSVSYDVGIEATVYVPTDEAEKCVEQLSEVTAGKAAVTVEAEKTYRNI